MERQNVSLRYFTREHLLENSNLDYTSFFLKAYLRRDVVLQDRHFSLIDTGIYLDLDKGYECRILPLEELTIGHSVFVVNTPGAILPSYRGSLKVMLFNPHCRNFTVSNGTKIAQLVLTSSLNPSSVLIEKKDFDITRLKSFLEY